MFAATLTHMEARRRTLWEVCLASLERFYLPDMGMLADRIIWTGDEWNKGTPSIGNTLDAVIALNELRALGHSVPLDPERLLLSVVDRPTSIPTFEDRALMLWAAAIGNPALVPQLRDNLLNALDEEQLSSMTLARTLNGLCQCVRSNHRDVSATTLARRICKELIERQYSRTGLFYRSTPAKRWWRRRRPIASLSSQTYTIHALVMFADTFRSDECLVHARRCADALCQLQGPRGQWWWDYDVERGCVQETYPVYSVNQDTAIPMALGALERALGEQRYSEPIDRGLDWLFGNNEVQRSLVDEEREVIWRGIEPHHEGFRIISEMRSYHPARCLYALAVLNSAMTDSKPNFHASH